jgi:chromosome partitioning protein
LDLSGAEIELSSEPGREYILRINRGYPKDYDYIILSPPSLGLYYKFIYCSWWNYHSIASAILAMQGLAKLVEVVEKIKSRLNKGWKLEVFYIIRWTKVLNRDVLKLSTSILKAKFSKQN